MSRSAFDPSCLPLRWDSAVAEEVLEACRESGLSVAGFAREHGWDPMRLYRWRRELGETEVEEESFESLEFIELEVTSGNTTPLQSEAFVIEFEGIRIHVPLHFDAGALSKLMDAILC